MKITIFSADPNSSQIVKPRRVFHCDQENRMMMRDGVWKDHKGEYHCGSCSGIVIDVTNTVTGHDFMEIVGV